MKKPSRYTKLWCTIKLEFNFNLLSLATFLILFKFATETSGLDHSPINFTPNVQSDFRRFKNDDDAHLLPKQLIVKYGYRYKYHEAVTKDGYILPLYRIPGPKTGKATKGPLLLMHGLLSSASDWLVLDQARVFPYLMAAEGYDVFLGNARGNSYTSHRILKRNDPKFWDFSFHEMGDKDIPAMIDKILKITKATKLRYVGHSMGATIFYICMSLHPEYNKKVEKMVAFAPAVYLKHCSSPAHMFKYVPDEVIMAYNNFSGGAIFEEHLSAVMKKYDPDTCRIPGNDQLCMNSFFFLVGYNPKDSNSTTTDRVVGHSPSGASVRSLIHYVQFMRIEKFKQYDHGTSLDNILNYGHPEPPLYHLDRVKVPILVVYGGKDKFIVPEDAEKAMSELRTNANVKCLFIDRWNHLDFTYADNANEIYKKCIQFFA